MGFTVDAKHVILCGILTLFLTWAAFHDKFPHGDSVSVQGRKDLSGVSLTDTTPVLGDASDATEDVTVENNVEAEGVVSEESEEATQEEATQEEATQEDAAQTVENVEFSAETQEDSEEPRDDEQRAAREMEENPAVITPEPEFSANPFLAQIQQNNMEAAKKEDIIQSCIAEDGCGTP